MSFRDDLWDGFEEIQKRVKNGQRFTKQMVKFLQKVAGLSSSYGKGLSSLCKGKDVLAFGEPQDESLHKAWQTLLEELSNIGKSFVDFSEEVGKRIPETIAIQQKEGKSQRKSLLTSGSKLVNGLHKSESNASKAKSKMSKLKTKQESSNQEYENAKNSSSPNASKLGKKADDALKTADRADRDFTDAIDGLKKTQEKYYKEEMPSILQGLQAVEETRINNTKIHFTSFSEAIRVLPPSINRSCDTLESSIKSINSQYDIQVFSTKYKSPSTGPIYASSDNFTSKHGSFLLDESSDSALSPKSPRLSSFISPKKEQKPLKEKSNSSISSAGEPVTSLYEYHATDENELSFPENAQITVLQRDDSGWWQGSYAGKIGMFPSNFVKDGKPDTNSQPSLYPSVKVQSSSSSTPNYEYSKCKVVYAYDASDENELSVKEGDILSIESEQDGWIFAYNSDNSYGRIPSNYVEYL